MHPGGIDSLDHLGPRTASGLRRQRAEIKYRKPIASNSSQRSPVQHRSPANCGRGGEKMILDDLFPGKLQSSSEVIENCVDTEAKWNRFGIASIKSEPEYGAARDIMSVRSRSTGRRPRVGVTISRPFRVRYRMGLIQRFSGLFSWKFSEGVGGLNLWDLRGAVTARGSRTGFFWRSRTFDYFSRNQTFQTARHWRPERKPSPRNRLAGPSPSMGAPSRPVARIIFQAVRAGGGRGHKSSAPTRGRDRMAGARIFARDSGIVFSTCLPPGILSQKIAAKFRVGGWP